MKVLIAAGGTGGHLYPGIVLGNELRKKGCEVIFVTELKRTQADRGNGRSVASHATAKILEREQFAFFENASAPFFGQSWAYIFKSFYLNFLGVIQGWKLIKQLEPDCIVSFGSYVSAPLAAAAFLSRVPIVLHEQNLYPGWANRFCSLFSKKVAVSFSDSEKYFKGKSVLVGNLLREELMNKDRLQARRSFGLMENRMTLLIFGGSAGAQRINQWILRSLDQLSDMKDLIQFLHISGQAEETQKLKEKYRDCQFHSVVLDYSFEMGYCYASADLAICRAGASAVAELIATRTPAILIPYPHAVGRHQEKNGAYLERLGSAILMRETDFLDHQLSSEIREIVFSTQEQLKKMRESYKKFPIELRNASKKMAELVMGEAR